VPVEATATSEPRSSAAPAQAALRVSGLNAFYGRLQILFDVSFEIMPGETVALLGRNGAGKTTTQMALAGVVGARAEAIEVDGVDIAQMRPYQRVRHGLSLVPSGARVFPNLTVYENLIMNRPGDKHRGVRWSLDHVWEVFPALKALRNSMGGSLSGGERQMLAVSRAMVTGPRVIMLDEPSEGIAPIVVRNLRSILRGLNEAGVAVLLAEQNYRFALSTATRACYMLKGVVAWEGAPAEAVAPEVIHRYLGV
jgi:branched-chain amino acid transport system ATP-binding protein